MWITNIFKAYGNPDMKEFINNPVEINAYLGQCYIKPEYRKEMLAKVKTALKRQRNMSDADWKIEKGLYIDTIDAIGKKM